MSSENTIRKQPPGRRFQPGVSGNPAGRPKGAKNKSTLAAEALLDGEAEALTRKAVEMALRGDTVALRLCLERLMPPRRDRPVAVRRGRHQGCWGGSGGRCGGQHYAE
jgi:hypothetical protein